MVSWSSQVRKQRISAPLFGSKYDENSDVEGVKQEEFDALRNGHSEQAYGSEFYYAGVTKNSCHSRLNLESQCSATPITYNEQHAMNVYVEASGDFYGCSQGNIIWLGVKL